MLALLMQALVFLSPLLPQHLQLQDAFCLRLHDISIVNQIERLDHANHDTDTTHKSGQHDHAECHICVLHHLIADSKAKFKLHEVKKIITTTADFFVSYQSIVLTPLAFKYPYKQAPPSLFF